MLQNVILHVALGKRLFSAGSARSHCGRSVRCQLAGVSLLSVRRAARPQLDPAGLQRADGDSAQVFLCKLWWSTTLPALLSISLFKSYLDIVWKMPPFFGLIKVCFLSIVWFLQCALESHAETLPVFVCALCFSDSSQTWPGLTLFSGHDKRNFLQMWNSVCDSVTKFSSLLPAAFLTLIHPIILLFDYSRSFASGFTKLEFLGSLEKKTFWLYITLSQVN